MGMTAVAAVLYAVANELAQTAKDSLPKLRDGERIQQERYADGVYYRETVFNGETFISQYDFRKREATSYKKEVEEEKPAPKKRRRKPA